MSSVCSGQLVRQNTSSQFNSGKDAQGFPSFEKKSRVLRGFGQNASISTVVFRDATQQRKFAHRLGGLIRAGQWGSPRCDRHCAQTSSQPFSEIHWFLNDSFHDETRRLRNGRKLLPSGTIRVMFAGKNQSDGRDNRPVNNSPPTRHPKIAY